MDFLTSIVHQSKFRDLILVSPVDTNYEGYDGRTLPFPDNSQDYVYSSHCLEHIADYQQAIKEWYRVVKVGGHIVTVVPHKYLYEKKEQLPSNWNEDHKRFYTPASLLQEFEQTLEPNSYRVRLLEDGDTGFNYSIPPEKHSSGEYEITLVIQKIQPPTWKLIGSKLNRRNDLG
jgi:SAM-dependent methyltransferase